MVQAMVFGNSGGNSGSGVGFTRDPASGENTLYLDFMFNAQGEDVVSGRRKVSDGARLQTLLPQLHARLQRVKSKLESEFRDLQDFEFTVQDGELFLLQTRDASRAPWAALCVAVDMVDEGLIEVPTALARLAALDLAAVARVSLDGNRGLVFAGQHAVVRERPEMLLQRVQAWRQEHEVGLSREASAAG